MVDGDAIHLPPRVLVTDAEERAAVAVARGLHAAGYSVGTASSTALAPAHWSRTVSRRHRVPDVREQPLAWADELVCVAARDGYCIVIPTTDRSLEVLSRRRDLFDGRVRLGLPPHENVDRKSVV